MKHKFIWNRLASLALSCCMMAAPAAAMPAGAAQTKMPDFSGLGAIGTLTAEQTEATAESIYAALVNHDSVAKLSTNANEFVPASTENMNSILCVFATVVGGWDVGILTIKNQISTQMSRSKDLGAFISGVNIYYLIDDDSYDATYKAVFKKLDAITAQVHDDWSPVEKALFLHDYMAIHFNYDYTEYATSEEEYFRHTAYNILMTGKGVCEAYAWLYNVLLEREGIESYMMTSDSLLHAWNVVHLEKGWAHVDVTWDDVYQEHAGLVRHDSFLKGHDALYQANHESEDWELICGLKESDMDITDAYDDGFWSDSIAAIPYYQGGWLAIIPDASNPNTGWFNLYKYNAATDTADCTTLLSLCEYWTVPGKMSYYPVSYIIPAVHDGVLYYSTPTSILSFSDGASVWKYDLPEELSQKYRIYGMYIEGDTLYYDLAKSASGSVKEYSIDLEPEHIIPTETPAPRTTTSTTTTTQTTPTTTSTTSTSTTTTTTTTVTTSTTTTTTTEATTTTTTTQPTTMTTTTTTTTTTETTTQTTPTTESTTAVTTTETTTIPEPSQPEPGSGDLDGDGEISVSDIITMKRYLLGCGSIPQEYAECADLYPDGVIDVYDLAFMKRALLDQQ